MARTPDQLIVAISKEKPGSRQQADLLNELKLVDRRSYEKIVANLKTTGADKSVDGLSKQLEQTKNATGVLDKLAAAAAVAKGGFNDLEAAALAIARSQDKANTIFAEGLKIANKQINAIEGYRIQLNKLNVGESRNFILSLRRQQDGLKGYNIQFKNLVNATENLREGINELTSRTFKDNEEALTKILVVNQKFGISQGESVDLLNNLNKGFNLSGQGADKFSRTLLNFARNTGQPFNRVFQDFNRSIDQFFVTLDSSKALQRFSVFQQAARTLGTSVSGLLGVVDKFDTIEGGFELGGQLNMILSNLGGSFDAQRAILMSRPERLRYLAETIAGVGGQIRGMSELGQRAMIRQLSQTTGFDVATIRGFIDKGIGPELDRMLEKSDKMTAMTANEQKKLADENTTREERRQITNDKLINKQTVALERLSTILEKTIQDKEQIALSKAVAALPEIQTKLERAIRGFVTQQQKGYKLVGTGGKTVTLVPGG